MCFLLTLVYSTITVGGDECDRIRIQLALLSANYISQLEVAISSAQRFESVQLLFISRPHDILTIGSADQYGDGSWTVAIAYSDPVAICSKQVILANLVITLAHVM